MPVALATGTPARRVHALRANVKGPAASAAAVRGRIESRRSRCTHGRTAMGLGGITRTKARRRDVPGDAPAVRFVDFSIRGWREGPFVQVIAHSTPAGGMRQPISTRLGPFDPNDYRLRFDAPLTQAADVGRELARVLLPPELWRLLAQSLAGIAPRRDLGLRLRLCLDDDLIDLPWE